MHYVHWVIPIKLSWTEQLSTRIVDKSPRMFVVRVHQGIRFEFTIDPVGNKSLQF